MILGLCLLALAEPPAAVGPPCETARLLKVRTVERAEGRPGGPLPPTHEGATRVPEASSGTLYDLTLSCGEKAYVARVAGGTPGFRPDDLEAAVTLRLRAEGRRLYLRREGGTEFEATLAAAPSTHGPPPR
ncbi:MAG TPA: hypothetical protein VGB87_20945 [Vicinamibacteria bacterium]